METFRLATKEDLSAMLQIYADYVNTTTYSFEYTAPTLQQFSARFENITAFFPWYVVEQDRKIIGYAYADKAFERAAYGWDADLSIYLAPAAHGKGIGKKLYGMLLRDLSEMGFYTAYALVTEENFDSRAFHEKLGFTLCTVLPKTGFKMGRWLGIYWYEKQLVPRTGTPEPVRSYKTVSANRIR